MRYKLRCTTCKATAWVRITEDDDTNSWEISGDAEIKWDESTCDESFAPCSHDDFDVIDNDPIDDPMEA